MVFSDTVQWSVSYFCHSWRFCSPFSTQTCAFWSKWMHFRQLHCRWLVTAAHCIKPTDRTADIRVVMGSSKRARYFYYFFQVPVDTSTSFGHAILFRYTLLLLLFLPGNLYIYSATFLNYLQIFRLHSPSSLLIFLPLLFTYSHFCFSFELTYSFLYFF